MRSVVRLIKKVARKCFVIISYPVTCLIRAHLEQLKVDLARDVGLELQRRATRKTVDYIQENLAAVDSVGTDLEVLAAALEHCESLEGKLACEFGVCHGRSINFVADLVSNDQTVYGFDSFEGLPERWRDGYGKGAFRRASKPMVRGNVVLIEGLFSDTLPGFQKEHGEDIAFLHVDCDLYSSTKDIFDVLGGQIRTGCVIVFDEYFNYDGWEEGEWKAFQEFVSAKGLEYRYICYNRTNEQVAVKIT